MRQKIVIFLLIMIPIVLYGERYEAEDMKGTNGEYIVFYSANTVSQVIDTTGSFNIRINCLGHNGLESLEIIAPNGIKDTLEVTNTDWDVIETNIKCGTSGNWVFNHILDNPWDNYIKLDWVEFNTDSLEHIIEFEDLDRIEEYDKITFFDTEVGIYGVSGAGLRFVKTFPPGKYEVTILAYEQHAGDEYTIARLINNSMVKLDFEIISTSKKAYTDTTDIYDGNSWKLIFVNDLWTPEEEDRNLFIDRIIFRYISKLPFAVRKDSVIVTWDNNTEEDLAYYTVYYGINSRIYNHIIEEITDTTVVISDTFALDRSYYLAVTATDTSQNTSRYSEEVTFSFESVEDDTIPPPVPHLKATPVLNNQEK